MERKATTLTIVILIAIAVIGFALYQYFGGVTEPIQEEKPGITYPAITPKEVVEAFYRWYSDEEHKLPSDAYKSVGSLTAEFKQKIEQELALSAELPYDLFLCEAKDTESLTIHDGVITDTHANVVVDGKISETEEISFLVELLLRENAWQIGSILCFTK